ncbi:PAS domain S-box-containing protein/diguanylate cyclase (GGDEF) domain-containing protein [Pseudomonas sp. NFACC23-1]|uniref:putative bifunctional diguanylate cyclase/phosphodiesterase n=1 Tax=unclassified Pseudomonas TaxID=196821 RepID=UPI0008871843|nr:MULTISPECIES: EAL domain-containing protein [unclassified Pseudomonas]SDB11386.1 PAS domain S-box-containing protein/diguanylate cyclase (GGDEF) domain-containing protein [Pseudomonas sp. NFACC17-2]SEI89379.1 PAS domain S-box-containing protein/diguanylate cyclase (GGDEF) domain-containing protein [Pseudomonas sp. NFACC23-1]SFW16637.1 PAS domain S-box-containing protein/diguanylate cyclase (GGDEF) domain-containing protein [Pseudomonas sp. NFACC16-2]
MKMNEELPPLSLHDGTPCAEQTAPCARLVREAFESAADFRAFRALAENTPDTIARYDCQAQRTYANPAFARMVGVPAADLLGSKPSQSGIPQMLAYEAALLDVARSGQPTEYELSWTGAGGHLITSQIRLVPECGADGRVISVLAVGRDISEFKATERRLEQAEAMARLGHWQLDYRPGSLRLSAQLCRMLDKPRDWAPTQSDLLSMLALKDRRRVLECLWQARSERSTSLTLEYCVSVGGQSLHLHSDMNIEYDADGRLLQALGTVQDVSELKAYQRRLHTLAFYDALTELPNRELFRERLQQALAESGRSGRQVVVAVLDLDNFKVVNDTFGHGAGDELLRETARRLRRFVCGNDSVARLGGDEFALILTKLTNAMDLEDVGKRILQAITGIYRIQDREVFVSGSLGISRSPTDAHTISELLQYADSAMYHAKAHGRNNVQLYSPRLTQQATERQTLAASLRHALHNGELALHYQPQIDLASGRVIGAEALLRWNHPEQGQVPPDTFIPIAEETGLIVSIGEWVLNEACRFAAAWNREGRCPSLKIAVNLSPRQFQMNDLFASVQAILQQTRCEPGWLALEITEGLLLENSSVVRETLEQLSAMGISIAIDDFGTGYSALGYLSRFPIETLKIDRSFIHDIEHNRDSAELVKAIISMAHSLRLSLIAEGVEEVSQQVFLQRYGCHSAQGWLYGKAVSQEDFGQLSLFHAAWP